jgi:hypothetical protein
MQLVQYIQLFSVFIWLLIPLRQIKTRFFLFFLVLAMMDFLYYLLTKAIIVDSLPYYLLWTVILLYTALFDLKTKNRHILIICLVVPGLLILLYQPQHSLLFQTIIHLIIFTIFLRVLIIHFGEKRNLLWFHLMLIVYEFSILLKFFVYYTEIEIGIIYYYVTTAFQILMGVFFIFVSEKNSPAIKM